MKEFLRSLNSIPFDIVISEFSILRKKFFNIYNNDESIPSMLRCLRTLQTSSNPCQVSIKCWPIINNKISKLSQCIFAFI